MPIHNLKKRVPMPIKRLVYQYRDFLAWVQLEFETITAKINPTPIIILGNQKAGTSAIASLLGHMTGKSFHVDLMKANERNIYVDLKKGTVSFDDFINLNRLEFSKEIVKEPNLSLFYDELTQYFASAKFILVVRDPRDNIRSILDRYKISGNIQQMKPEHYQSLVRSWPSVFDGQWLGIEGENHIEMLAGRWNYIADVFLLNSNSILLVKYEQFLQNKIQEISRIAESLGMEKINDISDQVNIQYQPAGKNKNVKYEEFFCQENLDKIERICGARMKKLGYKLNGEIKP